MLTNQIRKQKYLEVGLLPLADGLADVVTGVCLRHGGDDQVPLLAATPPLRPRTPSLQIREKENVSAKQEE